MKKRTTKTNMVKKNIFLMICFVVFLLTLWLGTPVRVSTAPVDGPEDPVVRFDDYFVDKTMRIDYYHMADKTNQWISIDRVHMQGTWAGNPGSLIDEFNNGQYYIEVEDAQSGRLIFSRGFNSFCGEYITTDMAAKGIKRTYHESALIPFPKQPVRFSILCRDKSNRLQRIFSETLRPDDRGISREALVGGVTVFTAQKAGPPHQKVDVAILAEGYGAGEKDAFKGDLDRAVAVFFELEPYKSYRDHFNMYGVFKPSPESGVDEPGHGVFRRTAAGASFSALGLYRYMLTEDNRAIRDIAAHVPYDALMIMVNTRRYGGGGLYNTYCLFSLNEEYSTYLMLHEFGHSFAGLGDEYYASTVAYNDFYPPGVEPTEPNITALGDPENLKWKDLVTPHTPIPTPWEKKRYDQLNDGQKKKHLQHKKYRGKVGAFEGAGYSSDGLYRPSVDCLMFTKGNKPLCAVCRHHVVRVIRHYSPPALQ